MALLKPSFLNPAAFAIPAPGRIGNLGRNALHGPSLSQFDLTVQKRFPIRERKNLEFRAEMFNVPNHLSAFTVSNTLRASNFGQVTATTDPRTMEFALKVHF